VTRPAAPRAAVPRQAVAAAAPEAAAPEPRATETRAADGEVAPAPAPAPRGDEPVVAAPSRRPDYGRDDGATRGRRRGGWNMGDVIRNAPFPINP
jgi:hypothetical protein